jgi:hypothetical protein
VRAGLNLEQQVGTGHRRGEQARHHDDAGYEPLQRVGAGQQGSEQRQEDQRLHHREDDRERVTQDRP